MTGLIILVIVILFILLYANQNRISEYQKSLDSLARRIGSLTDEIETLSRELKKQKESRPEVREIIRPAAAPIKEEQPKPVDTPVVPGIIPEKITPKRSAEPIAVAPVTEKKPVKPAQREFNWISKNTDLEKFIGENLANKIGIAVLVLGISFFVKYAIDKNWINETGRVLVGLACGSILIGIAHYIRNSYRSFSSVLIGGGLTVFYFSVAFAFHQYQLIGQQSSFIAMVVITGFAVLLSILYDRQELAILAAIGGFVTPFLVSNGKENYVALFTYLCILNTGMMALSWFKRWHSINIITLFFTTFIYGGWLVKSFIVMEENQFPYKAAFFFATIFYLLFIAMSLLNNLRLGRKFTAFDFIIVLSIHFLYYIAAMMVLDLWKDGAYQGLFTAALGIFNILLAAIFYSKKKIDPNFVSLLIGLAISFISLTAPVQLRGNHVVLFWAAELVLLFWLYQRTRITHLKVASFIVTALMTGSLFLTWASVYFSENGLIPIIINKGFITTVAAATALFIYYLLLKKEQESEKVFKSFSGAEFRKIVLAACIIIAYMAGALEIFYQFSTRYPETRLYAIYLQLYSFAYTIVILQVFKRSAYLPIFKFLGTALCMALYLISTGTNYDVSFYLLANGPAMLYWGHWIGVVLLGWLLIDLIYYFFRQKENSWSGYRPAFTCMAAAGVIILLSVEVYQVILWVAFKDPADWAWWENLYYKAGLSIIWGICSFVMMWLGMRAKFSTLRIISLTLFTITLIKLFFYDIRKIPPGGKIVAFMLLGVLLLTVSFMYQRLKKMIIDNTAD